VYQSSLQRWLCGAAFEIFQTGSTLGGSKGTWSFAPLEIEGITEAVSAVEPDTTSVPDYSRNITFETRGLRAWLDRREWNCPKNVSMWLEQISLPTGTLIQRRTRGCGKQLTAQRTELWRYRDRSLTNQL
jgi:hypothetical protein